MKNLNFKGSVGLFWIGSKDIITAEKHVLNKNNKILYICEHNVCWKNIDKDLIIKNGGNPENSGWKSLPRGLVGFSITNNIFCIACSNWLQDYLIKKVAKEFGLKKYKVLRCEFFNEVKDTVLF